MTRKEMDAKFARMNNQEKDAYIEMLKALYVSLLVNGKERTLALIMGDAEAEQEKIDATCAELLAGVNI